MRKDTMAEFELASKECPPSLRGYDAAALSEALGTDTGDVSPVQQSMRDEVDINTIVRRYGITQSMPFGANAGVYGDFTGVTDYESAVELIEGAQERFMALPPEVRERFSNDPGKLIAFAQSVSEDEFTSVVRPDLAGGVDPEAPITT